jgi:hypothetical protein
VTPEEWMRSRPRDGGPIPGFPIPGGDPVPLPVFVRVGSQSERLIATIEADSYEEALVMLAAVLRTAGDEVRSRADEVRGG